MSNKRSSPESLKRHRQQPPLADLAEHDTPELTHTVHARKPSYIDSLGEKRSDYTIDEESGLFIKRPSPKHSPSNSVSDKADEMANEPGPSTTKGKAPASPPGGDIPMTGTDDIPRLGGPVRIDGEVYFTGQPEELDPLWLHMFEKETLDPNMDTDRKRCAYLSTRFRGKPKEWLIQLHSKNPAIFSDYEAMSEAVKEKYARLKYVSDLMIQKRMAHLTQNGKARDFVQEYDLLASQLGWSDNVRATVILEKLRKPIRDHMILHEQLDDDYDELKNDIIKFDEVLALQSSSHPSGKKKRTGKKKTTKCGKCGRTNHTTDKCFAKTTVNMIRVRGTKRPEFQRITVTLQGAEFKALVDSGSDINCVSERYAWRHLVRDDTEIFSADGRLMTGRYGSALIDSIDGLPFRFHVVPGLTEDVILGLPYLEGQPMINHLALSLLGQPRDGGRMRMFSALEMESLEAYVEEALANNWIRKSTATRACNVLMVPKKNGKLRTCIDFRPINEVTRRDHYPLPLIKTMLSRALGSQWFTVLDIKAAFHMIKVQPGQEHHLAFKTPMGTFEYMVMPFGITNGPSVFQRFIERVLDEHLEYAAAYIDDIIIFTQGTKDKHRTQVKNVMSTLFKAGLELATDKAQMEQSEVTYLGHRVGEHAIEAIIDYASVRDWPEPCTKKELQSYLGMANYWRDQIPGYGAVAAPLYAKTGNDSWSWTPTNTADFSRLKALIQQDLATFGHNPDKPVDFFTDASGFGLGGVAFQDGKPISIVSRGLSAAEQNYNTSERELLAIVFATKKWRHIIESTRQPITLYTDHKLITQNWNKDYSNRRMNRWLTHLMQLPLTYAYIEGKLNPADYPSRRADYEKGWGGEEKVRNLAATAQPLAPFWRNATPPDTPDTPDLGPPVWDTSAVPPSPPPGRKQAITPFNAPGTYEPSTGRMHYWSEEWDSEE